ncbi:cyclic nucleotide-gated ion channel 1-like [Impatiens glandulifera]|uniref:cyclic nucleotide-gated ion channel 1-like n=1 Tax=Impatiens glandulifera TaxID=253017 RepID=UPI001FB1109C|nr:cyclic nucleotide-gated ion channel 1-like [Impatiens glandulifera]
MNFKPNRFVRFKAAPSSQSSPSFQNQYYQENGFLKRNGDAIRSFITGNIRKGFESGSRSIQTTFKRFLNGFKPHEKPNEGESKKKIFHPQGSLLLKWNKMFVLLCVIAVSLDPLFYYIPVIDAVKNCFTLDRDLQIIACVLRTFVDILYILRIIFQFRTGFITPSNVLGRGELVEDPYAIAKRYLSSYFIVDILSILPLPQVVILIIPQFSNSPISMITKNTMRYVILVQYLPRFFRFYPLYSEVTRSSGLFTEKAWTGAAFNLLLYMLASHIVGAFWYLFSVEIKNSCWLIACNTDSNCNANSLYCESRHDSKNYTFLDAACPYLEQKDIHTSKDFDFGIFIDALQSRVAESESFRHKFLYCFWWGLRNLSSLGQNLKTSTNIAEILFAVFIAILGLLLFSLLIGNMQKYLQSITLRVEEMRVKRQDAEQWMSHRMLPEEVRQRIRRYEQYKWQETRGVEENSLIRNLPKDIRRDIKTHLCLGLVTRVPMFEKMDDQLLDAICDRLKPVLFTANSLIAREGDPVDEMVFIMRGTLETMTTNGGRTGFFNSENLKDGDFCGEQLLTWALDPNSSSLPSSTNTVRAITDVEAFALVAEDLKFVASQFRRLNSKDIQHTFRYHSPYWRTWGASFIQIAWRRHCRRNLEKALIEEEKKLNDALAKETDDGSISFGAAIYVSKFATNAIRNLRLHYKHSSKLSTRLPPLLQKPSEPNFTDEG